MSLHDILPRSKMYNDFKIISTTKTKIKCTLKKLMWFDQILY